MTKLYVLQASPGKLQVVEFLDAGCDVLCRLDNEGATTNDLMRTFLSPFSDGSLVVVSPTWPSKGKSPFVIIREGQPEYVSPIPGHNLNEHYGYQVHRNGYLSAITKSVIWYWSVDSPEWRPLKIPRDVRINSVSVGLGGIFYVAGQLVTEADDDINAGICGVLSNGRIDLETIELPRWTRWLADGHAALAQFDIFDPQGDPKVIITWMPWTLDDLSTYLFAGHKGRWHYHRFPWTDASAYFRSVPSSLTVLSDKLKIYTSSDGGRSFQVRDLIPRIRAAWACLGEKDNLDWGSVDCVDGDLVMTIFRNRKKYDGFTHSDHQVALVRSKDGGESFSVIAESDGRFLWLAAVLIS